MHLFILAVLIWSSSALPPDCGAYLAIDQVYRQKFQDLVEDQTGLYVRGNNYILRHAIYRPPEEESRMMTPDQAAELLADFDQEGRFVRHAIPQAGLFAFSLTDDRRLYVYRAGSRKLDETSIRHTFPAGGAALAAAGEMLFDHHGRLFAINPYTGHYAIDPDLSHHQIRHALELRGLNLGSVCFYPWAFPESLTSHHSVGR